MIRKITKKNCVKIKTLNIDMNKNIEVIIYRNEIKIWMEINRNVKKKLKLSDNGNPIINAVFVSLSIDFWVSFSKPMLFHSPITLIIFVHILHSHLLNFKFLYYSKYKMSEKKI